MSSSWFRGSKEKTMLRQRPRDITAVFPQMPLKLSSATTILALALVPAQFAMAANCTWSQGNQPIATFVQYFFPSQATAGDPRCSGNGNCRLEGWLYQPQPVHYCPGGGALCVDKTRFPAIVFNHGHGQFHAQACAIADFF